jgi:hypothetical protein
MYIAKLLGKFFISVVVLVSITTASYALDWELNDIDSQKQISNGSAGGFVKLCYEKGNKQTVGIFFGNDLVFWLIKGSCARVRNAKIDVSISGNLENGDNAAGTAERVN